jgi:hypothetical protein
MRYWSKDITIDPFDATQNTWFIAVFSGFGGPSNGLGGLYRSSNRGQSWTRINASDRVESFTIAPTNTNLALMTTEVEGLWATNNLRAATATFTRDNNFPFRQPVRVIFNPFDPSEVWVSSFGGGLRVGRMGGAGGDNVFANGFE